ncbi:hypothetical protein ACQ5SO_19205 [Rhodovulum sp. DZ06]|uniref:hypothetical protein n=1 Tax=Rhodovulum sp. DZ06 TaxID=3425126 RepID=UPI003D330214
MRTAILAAAVLALAGCQSGTVAKKPAPAAPAPAAQAAPAYKPTGDLLIDSRAALETPVAQAELADMPTDALTACAANEARLLEVAQALLNVSRLYPELQTRATMTAVQINSDADLAGRPFTAALTARDAAAAKAAKTAASDEAKATLRARISNPAPGEGGPDAVFAVGAEEMQANQKCRLAARGLG